MNNAEPRGDILQITDSGFGSYPRYAASLQQIAFVSNVQHSFAISGLPTGEMTFSLTVRGPESAIVKVIRRPSSTSILNVQILAGDGTQLYGVKAPLSEWRLAESVNEIRLWHVDLRDMSLKARRQYTVKVSIEGSAGGDGEVFLEPQLRWGGNELP